MTCICSLAGTAACASCSNNPNSARQYSNFITWTNSTERTCKNETRHIGYGFACSVCEWSAYMPNDYGNDVVFDFNYCPSCGAKVVSE